MRETTVLDRHEETAKQIVLELDTWIEAHRPLPKEGRDAELWMVFRIARALRTVEREALKRASNKADTLRLQYEREGESVWGKSWAEKYQTARLIAEVILKLSESGDSMTEIVCSG